MIVILVLSSEPGNKAEATTLKPIEEILKEKFGLSKIIVCTDAGLSSYENRKNDAVSDRSFITVQSIKKMNKILQKWALDTAGWRVKGSDKKFDLSEVDGNEYYDTLFYKERWEPIKMSTGEVLEQGYIVTFANIYPMYETDRLLAFRLCLTLERPQPQNARAQMTRRGS